MRVHYTRAAERDLEEIAAYTRKRWGQRQCELYLDALQSACEEFLPESSAATQTVPQMPGLRRWRCWHHVIYFRDLEGSIEVVRVLHERMLPESHL